MAVKTIDLRSLRDESGAARFEREARATAGLSHPNIVTVHDSGVEGDTAYIVMELLPGPSLADELADGPLPVDEVVDVGRQVASALDAAHARGLVHRDIKPGNIVYADDGRVRVLDFGITQLTESTDSQALTATHTVMGTAEYLAPEQALGGRVDGRADLYALGCVLYALLAGQPPFRSATPVATMMMHANDPVPDVRALRPDTPDWLADLVHGLLAKNPDDRPAGAAAVAAALAARRVPRWRDHDGASRRRRSHHPAAGCRVAAARGATAAAARARAPGRCRRGSGCWPWWPWRPSPCCCGTCSATTAPTRRPPRARPRRPPSPRRRPRRRRRRSPRRRSADGHSHPDGHADRDTDAHPDGQSHADGHADRRADGHPERLADDDPVALRAAPFDTGSTLDHPLGRDQQGCWDGGRTDARFEVGVGAQQDLSRPGGAPDGPGRGAGRRPWWRSRCRPLADHTPPPSVVALVGSLQSELGCPGDWQPECPQTRLAPVAGSPDLWRATFDVPAGTYAYKVALNTGWDENYGANGAPGGCRHPAAGCRWGSDLHLRPQDSRDHR